MTAVLATAGNNQVTITWTPPANAEAVELTDYFIKVTPDLRAVKVAAPASSAVVSGLRNGTEYEFTVHAATADGSSEPSEAVRAIPSTGMEGEVAGLIVKFEAGTSVAEGQLTVPGEEMVDSVDLQVADTVGGGAVLVDLSESVSLTEAKVIAGELASSDKVAWAEPDQFLFTSSDPVADPIATPITVPDDSQYASGQWNLWDTYGVGIGDGTDAMTKAWAIGTGTGATVSVIDTGITPHEDLDSQLVSGYDFVSSPAELDAARTSGGSAVSFDGDYVNVSRYGAVGRDSNPADPGDWRGVAPTRDSSWHGTKMAGIIAAQARNSAGITGIAPGAKIQPIRALSWRGGLLSDIASSITWASGGRIDGITDNATPSDIINMSFAVQATCPVALQNAIDEARQRGAVLVAAAGNANDDVAKYAPANCNNVITVGATDRSGMRAPYSNYGSRIDISAPGGDINSGGVLSTSNTGTTDPTDQGYAADQGTSIAAAHVSAAAALIASRDQALTPDAITTAITGKSIRPFANTTCDADPTKTCGDGILSLAEIAAAARGDQDYAMSFVSASSQYAVSSSTTITSTMGGAFTVEAWVKPTNCLSGENAVLSIEYSLLLTCQSGNVWRYAIGPGSTWTNYQNVSTSVSAQLNQWQHIAVTRSAQNANIEFYFNGQLAHTQAAWNTAMGSGQPLYVANRPGQGVFNGQIDEVRLYSVYRGSSVTTDMKTYGPIDTTGLVAYYDFNEGPAGGSGTGTLTNKASGAASTTNLRLVNSPTYLDVKQTTSNGTNTVVTFPRSYLTAAGGWRVPVGVSTARTLVVAGGGGGGAGSIATDDSGWQGGGGGAGGYLAAASTSLTAGAVIPVTVGQGGTGMVPAATGDAVPNPAIPAKNGQDSVLNSTTAVGGGRGGARDGTGMTTSGTAGGSGGGGAYSDGVGGAGTVGPPRQGYNGGNYVQYGLAGAGGGGSAGPGGNTSGETGGAAGAGTSNDITGVSQYYAAGGNGRGCGANGSASGAGQVAASTSAAPNSGSGGGGGGDGKTGTCATGARTNGGGGGSGVIIVSYASSATCAPTFTNYVSGSTSYRVATFTDPGSCTWTVPSGVSTVDAVLVAGGGGGGGSIGGGGGAGEFKTLTGASVTAGSSQTILVGTGGSRGYSGVSGGNGGNSSAVGTTVKGGGGGSTLGYLPGVGGSGGGGLNCGAPVSASGAGTSTLAGGSVNNGGTGSTVGSENCVAGGGGGAGGVGGNFSGQNGGTGGLAISSTITGGTTYYAGGGGGGINGNTGALSTGVAGAGGSGIGGAGGSKMSYASDPNNLDGLPGMAGTGSGGGGASNSAYGGLGGSGTIILRYIVSASTTCANPITTSADGYIITAFKTTGGCTWTPAPGVTSVDYLVVAGGGGGGVGIGGGGGAGGLRSGALSVTAGTAVSVTVGGGGAGGSNNSRGSSGSNSVLGAVTSSGGGGGGGWDAQSGLSGGSGGGAAGAADRVSAGGSPSPSGQGNSGGSSAALTAACTGFPNASCSGGGGGGAGAAGSQGLYNAAGAGGAGTTVSWMSTTIASSLGVGESRSGSVYFAGGGGGGAIPSVTSGAGGVGGGAAGRNASGAAPTAAMANTGGGGGGNEGTVGPGGAGGSGVVVIRYLAPSCSAQTTTYALYRVVEFVGAGTCAWTVPTGITAADVLAVGGGGGGGAWVGGGGGGGGVTNTAGVALTPGNSISVTVGSGGAGAVRGTSAFTNGANGGSSSFGSASAVTALGGGVGASNTSQGAGTGSGSVAAGGGGAYSSGGANAAYSGGTGSLSNGGSASVDSQPHPTGGGGGAGGNGVNGSGSGTSWAAGNGGNGLSSSISGSATYYGGGGGGSAHGTWTSATSWDSSVTITPGLGGNGGGGTGGQVTTSTTGTSVAGFNGIDGLGGGGGGGANFYMSGTTYSSSGGKGGDGTIIVAYSIVPGAPTSVTSTASAVTTATVSWTAPTHTGGSAISGYTVKVSADGGAYSNAAAGTCNTAAPTSTSTSCTVTGLTAGTAYTFKVNAINANGAGTQSSATSSLTPYGALDHFAVTTTAGGALGAQTAATAFDVMVTAQDASNGTVLNYTGTVNITSTSLFSAGSGTTSAFTDGVLASHSITLIRAGSSQTVTATKTSSTETGTSASFTISAGAATKLQVLLPGEVAAPGTASGKTGAAPTAQTATTSFNATVNAVDANWNVVGSATPTVAITSSDGAATLPANAALVSGTKAFAVTLATSGSATVTATDQAGSSPLTAGTSASVTVNRTSQSALTMSSASTVAFGDTLTLDTSGGSGTGAVTYAVSTAGTAGCSISGSTLSVTGNANSTCAVTATKAQDSSYTSVSSSAQTITVTTRAITVTASSPSIAFGATVAPSVSVTTGSLSGTDAISGATYTYTGTGSTSYGPLTTAPTAVGSYLITPSVATFSSGSSSNYAIIYATGTLTISKAAQATLSMSSASTVTFGSTLTLETSGGSGSGAVTYAVTTPGTAGCSISGTTLSVSGNVGATCAVTATKAADASYLVASSSAQTITVTTRSITVTASSPSIAFGGAVSPSVSVTTGTLSGTDAISGATYTYTGTAGTSYGPLTTAPTAVGTYTVTPSVATFSSGSSSNYAISYAAGTLTISQASQATLSMSSASTVTFGSTLTLTTSGGSGTGAVTYAVSTAGTAGCSISGTTLSVTGNANATCAVTATKAADSSYLVATSSSQTITVGTRSITVTASSPSIAFGAAVAPTVSVTTGTLSGTDAISGATYTYVGTGSTTYASSTTAPTAVGTYSVTPSAATFSSGSSSNYAIQYAAGTLTITQAAQATLSMSSASTVTFGSTLTLTTSGGSGDGAVTYAVSTSGTAGCSIAGTTLSVSGNANSTCAVTATKAANASFLSATSAAQTITVTTRSITVTASSPSIAFGATVAPSVSVSTGTLSGTDAISGATYTYTGTSGTTYGPLTTAPTAVGTYSVTPSAATFSSGSSSNYAIQYVAGTLTISQAAQATLSFAATSATLGSTTTLATTGGSGGGTVTYSLVAVGTASCSLSGATLSYTSGGTCTISATKAADSSYLSATTGSVTFTVNGPSTATSTITASSASITANGTSTSTITVQLKDSSGTNVTTDSATVALSTTAGTLGSVTYAGSGSYTATLTSPTTVGSATITGTLNTLAMTDTETVSFVVGPAAKVLVVTPPVAGASGAALSIQPVVRITDATGNTLTTSTASVTVAPSAGSLSGTLTVSAVNGIATFAGLGFTGSTASATTLTFSSGVLTSATADVTPTGPGAAASLVITGSASQTAGGTQSVTITAKDAAGNTATGYTGDKSITFTGASSSPGGTAPTVTSKTGSAVNFGTATTFAFTSGVATVSSGNNGVMRLYKAESATVSVSDGSISSSGSDRLSVTVSAAAANQLEMATEPVAGASGSALSTQPAVYIRDAYGNATTSTATVTVTASGGTLGGAEATSGKAGVSGTATFTNLTFTGLTTTTYTLTFASSGLSPVTSSSITPSGSGAATSLVVTGTASQLAGVTQNLTITAKDATGNTVTAYSGDKSLTFSGAANSPDGTIPSVVSKTGATVSFGTATTITFTGGVATVSSSNNGVMRLYKAQTATVSVTDGTLASTGAGDLAVTVTAATASKVFILQEPVGGQSGALLATQPQAAIADAYGNTVTTSTASVSAALQSGSGLSGTTSVSSVSGVATFANLVYTGASAVNTYLVLSSSGLTPATSAAFTVTQGTPSASTSTISASPSSVTAGGSGSTVTVQLKDSASNLITTGGATVTMSTTKGLMGSVTDNGNGTYSAVLTPGATTPGTATVSATVGGATMTNTTSVTVSAGAASALSLARASVGTAAGAAFTTQPQVSLVDSSANVIVSDSSTIITASISAGGTLIGTRAATASSGVATFTNLGVSGTASTAYTITYSSGALTAATQSVTVSVGAATTIAVNAGNNQSATAGSAVATAPSVLVTDSGGNAVSGTSVTFAVASGAGSVSGGSATTNSSGIASPTSWTLGTTVGSNTLTATSGSLVGSPITFTATGTVGTASQLVLTTSAVGTASGAAFTTQPVVTIKDANSNVVTTDSTSTVTASVSTGGTLIGTTTATAVNGVATFSNLGISGTAGNTYVVTYSSGATTPATQNITVTAGAATQVVLTTSAAGATYGNVWTTQPVVQIRDSAGNVRTSDSSSVVTISVSTGGTFVGTATATAASGIATFSGLALTGAPATYTLTYSTGALTSANQVLALSQASQSITFGSLSTKTYGDAAFGLSATSSAGLTVSYASADTSICSVSGSAVSIVGAGTCTITASQAGNTFYSAATPIAQAFTINQANQATLAMTSASSAIYGETIALAASGGSGTGALVFGVTAGTCTVSGTTLTLGNAGSNCRVQATKVSDANYNSVTSTVQIITITRAGQVVSFTSSVPASPLPNGTYTPTASSISTVTGASSGLTPVFTIRGSSSAVCSISGGVVSFLTTGNCVIDADSALTTNFTAASTASQTISVGSLNQNITFAQPSNVAFGTASVSMGATASSDLTVSYSLGSGTTNSACTVSILGVVTILAVGTCEVTAAQVGDAQYAAASPVTRAFQVVASLASPPYLTSASAGDQSITVAFAVPGFTGGVSITAYRIVATPVSSGTTVTTTACTVSPCTISGLANGTSYTVTAAAINTAGTGPASSASTALTPATAAFAVSGLAATPGNTTVALSWTPLTNAQLGGGTFTRYVVSKRVAGTSPWIQVTNALTTQSTSSYTVTGLDNGTSYDFQLVAVTSANASEIPGNTAEVVQYPSTTPSAPRSLTALAATATDLQVSWQSPLSDGGAPLITPYYSVTVTSTSSGAASPITCTFASVTDRFCTAANLTNGALYNVSVGAINRMGTGTLATTTYAVPSSDATLADLEVNGAAGVIALTPVFASGTNAYTAEVDNAVTSVTVTATTTMGGSTININGDPETSGAPSASIPLTVGINTITVEVTASDPRYTETYEVEITRGVAPPSGDGSWTPSLDVVVPATSLISGTTVAAVVVAGELVSTVLSRNPNDSGWVGVGEGFAFSVSTRTASGAPESMTPGGVMRVPAGGSVVIRGDGYLPESMVSVFAVPRTQVRSDATAALRLLGGRATSGAIYLGSAMANANGDINDVISLTAQIDSGDYVLQINGYTPTSQVRSMNLALNVLSAAKPDTAAVKLVSKQLVSRAFYEARSDRFTADGLVKMRDVAKSVPKDARNVKVKVAGASVGLGSISENVALAGKRAERIADYLVAKGIQGDYEITFTTSFKVGGDRGGATDKVDKPLTTIAISYDVPVATT